MRRYAIIGSGGIGSYYGARLAEAGHDVHFLVRSDYDTLVREGLTVESVKGDIRLEKVNAYRDQAEMPEVDVVLVGIKTTGNSDLPEILGKIAGAGTMVILIQNGLGMEQELLESLPGLKIAGATAFICSSRIAPGHIRHAAYGELTLAAFSGVSAEELQAVQEDMTGAQVPCTIAPSYEGMRWRKLVWNIPYNGMSVTKNCKTDVLTFDPQYRPVVKAVMLEVIAAANACGVEIGTDFADKMIASTEVMAPYFPSMYLDYAAGRAMEIDSMYAAPVAEAHRHGFEMTLTAGIMQDLRKVGKAPEAPGKR